MTTESLDSPVRHKRTPATIASALFRRQNYLSVIKVFQLCDDPIKFLRRYVTNSGQYPSVITLRTPIGKVPINVYSSDDVQTVNEIFFRNDYFFPDAAKVVVDFGSNIGISAIYFLSRRADASCYCFEPLPQNVDRLKENLKTFAGRYDVSAVAVGECNGVVRFGWEPTGRYGGVGRETGQSLDVRCLDSNEQLARILQVHDQIDILKVDIETLESIVTKRIPVEIARRIRNIVVEYRFSDNPLEATHDMRRNNAITSFSRR